MRQSATVDACDVTRFMPQIRCGRKKKFAVRTPVYPLTRYAATVRSLLKRAL